MASKRRMTSKRRMRGERRLNRAQWAIVLAAVLALALGTLALAQVTMPQIDWWTVDGGGGTSSGDNYVIRGTIGQPEAGGLSEDGTYMVSGGFWGASSLPLGNLYLPIVQKH